MPSLSSGPQSESPVPVKCLRVAVCQTIQRPPQGLKSVLGKGFNRHGFVYLAFLKLKPTSLMASNVSENSVFFGRAAFQAWAKISLGEVESRHQPHT